MLYVYFVFFGFFYLPSIILKLSTEELFELPEVLV